jgi:hypothetical protein
MNDKTGGSCFPGEPSGTQDRLKERGYELDLARGLGKGASTVEGTQ